MELMYSNPTQTFQIEEKWLQSYAFCRYSAPASILPPYWIIQQPQHASIG